MIRMFTVGGCTSITPEPPAVIFARQNLEVWRRQLAHSLRVCDVTACGLYLQAERGKRAAVAKLRAELAQAEGNQP